MSTANATYAQAKAILSMLNQGTKKGSMYPAAWQLMRRVLESNIFSDSAIRELQELLTKEEASNIITGLLRSNDKPFFDKFEVPEIPGFEGTLDKLDNLSIRGKK